MRARASDRPVTTALLAAALIAFASGEARAQEEDSDSSRAAPSQTPTQLPADFSISASRPDPAAAADKGPPAEAPPARPWHKGIVVEGSAGVMGYFGAFRRLAPPAFFQRLQAGYEIFQWLMVFGGGELAFTDTSVGQDSTKVRAFPIWGFDGGARLTVRPTPRVGIFAQGDIGLMKADVSNNALAVLGYPDTETLKPFFGGRLGLEWYQIDRHIAFGLVGGPRIATGFQRSYGKGDTPLFWDAALALRYTF